jgi:polyribonucleotide nucleotidyltransferase
MRARLQKHAQRPSYSPPPPAARAHTGAAAADAGTGLSDTVNIPVEKIRVLIGPSGATIKQIRAQTGAEIHVDDDGTVRISGSSADVVGRAKAVILSMFKEIQVGETLQGVVVSVKEFGCFVQITPGKDGLVHISELAENRVSRVEDVVKVGDVFAVKCIGVDEGGRVRLSRKAALKDRELGR